MRARRLAGSVAVAAAVGLFSPPAGADDTALGIRAASAGLGLELTQALDRRVNVRLGGNLFNYKYDVNWDLSNADVGEDVNFDIKLKLRSISLLLDYVPAARGFRLSGGLFYNRNAVLGVGSGTGRITINDSEYNWLEINQLETTAHLGRRIAPYLGFGFGNAVGGIAREVTLTFDMGVIFQGTPDVSMRAVRTAAISPALQADMDAVAEEIAESDLGRFKYYPVVSLGIAVRVR
jgi:hypothetical protein